MRRSPPGFSSFLPSGKNMPVEKSGERCSEKNMLPTICFSVLWEKTCSPTSRVNVRGGKNGSARLREVRHAAFFTVPVLRDACLRDKSVHPVIGGRGNALFSAFRVSWHPCFFSDFAFRNSSTHVFCKIFQSAKLDRRISRRFHVGLERPGITAATRGSRALRGTPFEDEADDDSGIHDRRRSPRGFEDRGDHRVSSFAVSR